MILNVLALVGWLMLCALVMPVLGFAYLVARLFHADLAAEQRFSKRV